MTNVLFIEDDLLDQMSFRRFVKNKGLPYQVTMVASVGEALQKLSKEEYDIILSDFRLQDGTAFDFLDSFPELDTPFIFMTGAGAEDVAVKALRKGAHDYLVKDLDNNHLELMPLAVEKAIRQKRSSEIERLTQFDRSVAGVITTNEDGLLIDCNQTFAEMIGYRSKRQLLKDDVWLARFKQFISKLFSEIQEENGYRINHEVELVDRDGDCIYALVNFSIVHEGEQPVLRGTLVDITQLKEEERVRKAKEQEVDELQGLMKLRENLSSMIVHDLRNPLAVISLSAEMILSMSQDPIADRMAERIMMHATQLQGLIDDMLTTARMESGSLAIEPEEHNFALVVREAVKRSRPVAERYKVGIEYDLEMGQLPLPFDIKLIERVLDNLISNAIKFSPPKSTVRVHADRVTVDQRLFLRCEVLDEGAGVPPEDRERVFERFGVGKIASQNGNQIGLGLSFCKMVIDAHKGAIFIKENEPTGAIFTFLLPIQG